MNNKDNTDIIKEYFSDKSGFGSYKQMAIELFKKTILMLEEFNINYCLISGTLLGYVRHRDFIPWDDDIDLIVDRNILKKMPEIVKKYGDDINFIVLSYIVKTCVKNKGDNVNYVLKNRILNEEDQYTWPFIDLFFYSLPNDDNIIFFRKQWDIKHFFPFTKVLFHGIYVNIPNNPDHFLAKNYGSDYMTVLKSSGYRHRLERDIKDKREISMAEYLEKTNVS
jgi:hypothetical protein